MARTDTSQKYYAVGEAGRGLTQVLREVMITLVRSCEIALDEAPPGPGLINVTIDCDLVRPFDADAGTTGGWIVEDRSITLVGNVCNAVRKGVERIDYLLGCPTAQ